MKTPEVILLLSGGIDSTTLLAELTATGSRIHALSFDYGQRHGIEIEYAKRNAAGYAVAAHHILKIDFSPMAEGNLLTGTYAEETANPNIVPGRNLLMLSHAAAYAEAKGINDIFFAANADDGQRFTDCRPEFLASLNSLWRSCPNTEKLVVHSPFIALTKAAIIEKSDTLGVKLNQTISCYAPNGSDACGQCLSCQLRHFAIEQVNQKKIK